MEETDLITLVIHTEERALKLKEVLEAHGIKVELEEVVVTDSPLPVPVRKVRIPFGRLTAALKVTESGDAAAPLSMLRLAGDAGKTLLIPVDLSDSSLLAVRVGFHIARRFDLKVVLLHAYVAPMFNPAEPFAQVPEESLEVEAEAETDLYKIASMRMDRFRKQIEGLRDKGDIPGLDYEVQIKEGLPEQLINDFCREKQPLMVVMATRGNDRKASDLVGSVTAEVIDSCRVPVLTVPDNMSHETLKEIRRVAMFCTLTPFDVVTVRGLMRAFGFPACNVTLLPASDRPVQNVGKRMTELADYFTSLYPTAIFTYEVPEKGKFEASVSHVIRDNSIQLIIVPNKKSSAFSRFFRPTLAHRILFENDLPLFVLPV